MSMKTSPEATKIVHEIRTRLAETFVANTPALRNIRREVSRQIRDQTPAVVIETALILLSEESGSVRFVAYELVRHHKQTFESLSLDSLLRLGLGINSWSSVDSFAICLSGPTWLDGRISDDAVYAWADSEDLWWKRTAVVSAVALSRCGLGQDVQRLVKVCLQIARDREDMMVKTLSWALRELSKKHPEQARGFIVKHRRVLAARVLREVENKLTTGRKTP
jgi:3-methyladenine DNA glycosylase AlkD